MGNSHAGGSAHGGDAPCRFTCVFLEHCNPADDRFNMCREHRVPDIVEFAVLDQLGLDPRRHKCLHDVPALDVFGFEMEHTERVQTAAALLDIDHQTYISGLVLRELYLFTDKRGLQVRPREVNTDAAT